MTDIEYSVIKSDVIKSFEFNYIYIYIYISLCKTCDTLGGASFAHRGII